MQELAGDLLCSQKNHAHRDEMQNWCFDKSGYREWGKS